MTNLLSKLASCLFRENYRITFYPSFVQFHEKNLRESAHLCSSTINIFWKNSSKLNIILFLLFFHLIDEDHDYHSTSASSGLTNTLCGLNMCQENVTPSPSSTSSTSLGPPKVSRKQKSLGLLCEKFMARFPESVPDGEKCEIPLDDLAKQMATERRRIYDIVNVLEAVQMMTKVRLTIFLSVKIPTE